MRIVAAVTVPSTEWIRHLPKAEIHVHLEGCLAFDGMPAASEFADLSAFLEYLDRACALVDTAEAAERVAYDAAARIGAAGTRYADVIFNPSHWPAWHDRLDAFVAALDRGFAAAEADGFPPVSLCVSIGRHQSAAEACELATWAAGARGARLVGLSIDGNEAASGRTGPRFAEAFAIAADRGLRRAVHAGESSGPEGVRDAIEQLRAERIDHGVRAVEDPALVADLAARGITLAVCPTSNLTFGLATAMATHPIEALRRAGVAVCVNTDDPVLFATDLVSEYTRCAQAFAWDRAVVAALARTSITGSFAPAELVQRLLAELDAYLGATAPAETQP